MEGKIVLLNTPVTLDARQINQPQIDQESPCCLTYIMPETFWREKDKIKKETNKRQCTYQALDTVHYKTDLLSTYVTCAIGIQRCERH